MLLVLEGKETGLFVVLQGKLTHLFITILYVEDHNKGTEEESTFLYLQVSFGKGGGEIGGEDPHHHLWIFF